MNLLDVINRFKLVSGLDSGQVSEYLPLCTDARCYLLKRLRVPEQALSDADRLRLANCAGVLANLRYRQYSGQQLESLDVSGVKLKFSSDEVDRAYSLFCSELEMLGDIVYGDDFFFERVRT